MFNLVVILVVILFVLIFLSRIIGFIPQSTVYIVEQFGKYHTTWEAGLHIRIPIIQQVTHVISLKEQCADYEPQQVITKDNVMLTSDSVVFFKIFDSKLAAYGVEDYSEALENLSATILRSVLGEMTLDECLNSRDEINARMLSALDTATDPWGIKITRVEIKNITPPAQMQEAMERQATAEREKRANILTAEGEKESAILKAQGNKQAAILNAEAEKEKILRKAEADAKAIKIVNDANADAIRVIREAHADEAYLTIKKLETLGQVADGKATKLYIPSDLASTAGVLGTLVNATKETNS